MRIVALILMTCGTLGCTPVVVDPPVDPAVLAAVDADCDIHEILEEQTFIPQPSPDDPVRRQANQAWLAACIAAGGDLAALNEYGRSPLAIAAYRGDLASLRQLIAAGADPNLFGAGSYHPVASATIGFNGGDAEVVQLLLDAGGNPDGSATVSNDAPQPLATAIWNNDIEIVRMLIAAGANVAIRDKSNGNDMVERALLSDEDNGEILTMLFQAGLSPTAPLSRGRTPFERVMRTGNTGELRAIVLAGQIDVNASGRYPNALWAVRAYSSSPQFIRELIRLGADPNKTDERGETVLQYASRFDPELAAMLRQAGVRR